MMQEVRELMLLSRTRHITLWPSIRCGKMGAPRVVAKAQPDSRKNKGDRQAERVPVFEDKPLARTLFSSLDVNQEIPEAFYKAVAAILAQVYRMKGKE